MNKILVYTHLGLGDIIECNGMIRYYSEKYDIVEIFSKKTYYEMCKFMYRDNKNIIINPINDDSEAREASDFISKYDGDVLIAGHREYFSNLEFFRKNDFGPAESFYHIAKVPWEFRNSKFYVERNKEEEGRVFNKLNPIGERYVFIHDDVARGFEIKIKTDKNIIRNDSSENIFNMMEVIERADEVHCMSSSVLCMIDCFSNVVELDNLYLHHNVRKVKLGRNSLAAKWNIV
jgi:hypothetical protein